MTYTQPLILVFSLLALVGILRLRHCTRRGLAILGVAGLTLLSWPPVDWLLSRPLEGQYPVRPVQTSPVPQAIVVLSSAVSPAQYERPFPLPDKDTFDRCELAAWLHKRWPTLPVLACGGARGKHQPPFSAAMRELLRRAGVPDNIIWTEERSYSTHESAVYGSEILRQHGIGRIALVVDAQSMPRAAACFRKQGIAVVPAPCEFHSFGPFSEELLPNWNAIRRNERTLHEMVGLGWYWLRGWI